MVLGLIGMSGIGKTAWANRLAGAGFDCLHCDDLIAARLCARFAIASPSLGDVGAWMGLPHEQHYPAREAAYMAEETAVLRALADDLARGAGPGRRLVIDFAGSAIYADRATLDALRGAATIVYLAAGPAHQRQLLQAYIAQPRPLIWNGAYRPAANEPPAAALARCYAHLLAQREARYEQLCHVRLDAATHTDPALSVAGFLRLTGVQG